MAADTTGNKSLDSIRTNQLCLEILLLSPKVLVSNGVFVSKVFMGNDFDEIKKLAKANTKEVSKDEAEKILKAENEKHIKNV